MVAPGTRKESFRSPPGFSQAGSRFRAGRLFEDDDSHLLVHQWLLLVRLLLHLGVMVSAWEEGGQGAPVATELPMAT
jgi:hypothetical protein